MDKKHIKVLLDFYYENITAQEFMRYLNSQLDLQQKFDKILKRSVPSDYTPIEWLNSVCAKIGTAEDGPLESTDGEYHIWSSSAKSFLILLYVKEFLAKSDAISFLAQDEINDMVIAAVTDSDAFYNATAQVEAFILTRIIADMPPVKTLNGTIRYVKKQMKLYFKCDNKMPKWLQGCEWAFNENGEPMIFKSERGDAHHKEYTFYDVSSNSETVIEQFD